jgi:hypothetical protein
VHAEQHIHDTQFLGFRSLGANDTATASGSCIPSADSDRSVAIALNPSQIDMQPNLITSNVSWAYTTDNSRFGLETSGAHLMMLHHDLDGSASTDEVPAQLLSGSPAFVAPYPLCYEAADMVQGMYICPRRYVYVCVCGSNVFMCILYIFYCLLLSFIYLIYVSLLALPTPSTSDPLPSPSHANASSESEFRQYSALWRDWGPQVIHVNTPLAPPVFLFLSY